MGYRRALLSGRLWSYSQTSAKLRETNPLAYLSIPSVTERKKKFFFNNVSQVSFEDVRRARISQLAAAQSGKRTLPLSRARPGREIGQFVSRLALSLKKIALFGCVSPFRPFHSTSFCYRSV